MQGGDAASHPPEPNQVGLRVVTSNKGEEGVVQGGGCGLTTCPPTTRTKPGWFTCRHQQQRSWMGASLDMTSNKGVEGGVQGRCVVRAWMGASLDMARRVILFDMVRSRYLQASGRIFRARRSIRLRCAPRTCAPSEPSARVVPDRLTKSRKRPTRKVLRSFSRRVQQDVERRTKSRNIHPK